MTAMAQAPILTRPADAALSLERAMHAIRRLRDRADREGRYDAADALDAELQVVSLRLLRCRRLGASVRAAPHAELVAELDGLCAEVEAAGERIERLERGLESALSLAALALKVA